MYSTVSKILSSKHNLMLTRSKAAYGKYGIFHNKSKQAFTMDINGEKGAVDYEKHGDVYDLYHTYIPENLRGNGYGKVLAKYVFNYIVENDLKMKITCEFLQKYYNEHRKKYEDYVEE